MVIKPRGMRCVALLVLIVICGICKVLWKDMWEMGTYGKLMVRMCGICNTHFQIPSVKNIKLSL